MGESALTPRREPSAATALGRAEAGVSVCAAKESSIAAQNMAGTLPTRVGLFMSVRRS
jgi:hypothetical protein